MQTSKITAATAPLTPSTAAVSTFTFNSGGPYTFNTTMVTEGATLTVLPPVEAIAISVCEKDITIKFSERINGQKIVAELQPEADLRPIEQLRISMLIAVGQTHSMSFNPITLIRQYGIERHFRFTAQ